MASWRRPKRLQVCRHSDLRRVLARRQHHQDALPADTTPTPEFPFHIPAGLISGATAQLVASPTDLVKVRDCG